MDYEKEAAEAERRGEIHVAEYFRQRAAAQKAPSPPQPQEAQPEGPSAYRDRGQLTKDLRLRDVWEALLPPQEPAPSAPVEELPETRARLSGVEDVDLRDPLQAGSVWVRPRPVPIEERKHQQGSALAQSDEMHEKVDKAKAARERYIVDRADWISKRATRIAFDTGVSLERARELAYEEAERDADKIGLGAVVDVQGDPTSVGVDSLIAGVAPMIPPFFRRTNIVEVGEPHPDDPNKTIIRKKYRHPKTGELTDLSDSVAGDLVDWWESLARQNVLTTEEISKMQAARRASQVESYKAQGGDLLSPGEQRRLVNQIVQRHEPTFQNVLSARDAGTGEIIETPFGALLRDTGIVPTFVNEAVMQYAPLFWEQDPRTGEPVNPNEGAYLIHKFIRDGMAAAGKSEEEINRATTGRLHEALPKGLLPLAPARLLPVPFQGIQRSEPTAVDPTARRAAASSGSFLGRVATAQQSGRSGGDEGMALPAYVADFSKGSKYEMQPGYGVLADEYLEYGYSGPSSAFWPGLGLEMVYGVGPISAGKGLIRAGLGVAGKAAQVGAAKAVAKGATKTAAALDAAQVGMYAAAHPIEAAKRAKNIRLAQELAEGRVEGLDDADILMGLNDVRRVTGEVIAENEVAPYSLAAFLRLREKAPVTVGDLNSLGANSTQARRLMEEVGLLNRAEAHVLSPVEKRNLATAASSHIASAYADIARNIAKSDDLTDVVKAQRLLEKIDAQGLDRAYIRGVQWLELIERGLSNRSFDDVIDEVFPVGAALAIRNDRPVVGVIHEVGAQILRAARSKESVRAEGITNRIINRRLGSKEFNKDTLMRAPEEVHRASVAAAGRAVEATLENAIPSDMVFVTRTLMAPRKALTNAVYNGVASDLKQVGANGWTAKKGPYVNGVSRNVYTYADPAMGGRFVRAVGAGNVARSAALKSIARRLAEWKPLTAVEHDLVQETFKTKAFESVLGKQAKEALFEGAQTGRAAIAGVNVGLQSAPEARVSRNVLFGQRLFSGPAVEDAATLINELSGQRVAKAMSRVKKSFKKLIKKSVESKPNELAPYALSEMRLRLARERGSLGESFFQELRDRATNMVGTDSGQRALNKTVRLRQDSLIDAAVNGVDREAARLQRELGMSREEAYYFVAYQHGAGRAVEGLGHRPTDPSIVQEARARAAGFVMGETWAGLVKSFFGPEVFDAFERSGTLERIIMRPEPYKRLQSWRAEREIARRLKQPEGTIPAAPRPGPEWYRPVSTGALREVIKRAREASVNLEKMGLQRGLPGRGIDAIADTLYGWALGVDDDLLTRKLVAELRRDHPGVFVDLMPSLAGARPDRVSTTARFALDVRGEVLREIGASPSSPWYSRAVAVKQDPLGNFTTKYGTFVPLEGSKKGSIISKLDNIANKINIGMHPKARWSVAENVLKKAFQRGESRPSAFDMSDVFGDVGVSLEVGGGREFSKEAVVRGVSDLINAYKKRFNEAQLEATRTGNSAALRHKTTGIYEAFDNDADRLMYTWIDRFKGEDEALVGIISEAVFRRAAATYVAPLVDELATSFRLMGHTPGTGKDDALDIQKAFVNMKMDNPSLMILPPKWRSAVEELQRSAESGNLARNIGRLRQAERWEVVKRGSGLNKERRTAAAQFAAQLLGDALSTDRRWVAGGMLGGGMYLGVQEVFGEHWVPYVIPVPNLRYMGMNLLTAPLIALTTVGAAGVVRMKGLRGFQSQGEDVMRQIRNMFDKPLVNANRKSRATDIEFVDKLGRPWTRQELDDAIGRNNILISRGQVEFNDAFNAELTRAAGVMADGKSLPKGMRGYARRLARQLDPTATNIAQYVANATDKAFRENTFATALREGMTEDQAAQLARAVVLDYGRVPEFFRNHLNRYVLFATFRTVNTIETMEALARDPEQFMRLLNLMDNHQNRHEAGVLGPDYAKVRPLLSNQFIMNDNYSAAKYGPGIPGLEAVLDLTNLAAYTAQLGSTDNDAIVRAVAALREENLAPLLATLSDLEGKQKRRPTDVGHKVPTWVVEYAVRNGPNSLWPWMRKKYNMLPVRDDKKKTPAPGRGAVIDPQAPEAGFQEYYFAGPEDEQRFILTLAILTHLGMTRSTRDWTNFISTAFKNENVYSGKGALPSPIGQAVGLETPIQLGDTALARGWAAIDAERRYRAASREAPAPD